MKKAKLQLALDDVTLEAALALAESARPYVDILEVGTPLVIREGMHAVRALAEAFPEKEILADLKVMDAGEYEAGIAFEAGADYCTVLGCTDLITISGCLKAAQAYDRNVFVDMICVEDMAARVQQLEAIGVTHIAAHTGTDRQTAGGAPLEDLRILKAAAKRSVVSVAGGIAPDTVNAYLLAGADVVIVGGGICHAKDPAAAAKAIWEKLQED